MYEYISDDKLIYRWIFEESMTKGMEIPAWERILQVDFRLNMFYLILGLNKIIFVIYIENKLSNQFW